MVRTALTTLSVAVVMTAAGAVVQGAQMRPAGVGQAVATSAHATPEPTGAVQSAGGAVAADVDVDVEPTTFTLAELHRGEVSAIRFAAFWDAELERIRTAPCPAPTAPGSTVVVASVGATPPPHLDEYTDYAPLLAEARAEAAAACA